MDNNATYLRQMRRRGYFYVVAGITPDKPSALTATRHFSDAMAHAADNRRRAQPRRSTRQLRWRRRPTRAEPVILFFVGLA